MSKYESIVPENIESNTFDFHGASIEIDNDGGGTDEVTLMEAGVIQQNRLHHIL